MSWFKKHSPGVHEQMQQIAEHTAMLKAGWTLYPENATDEEVQAAIANCMNGGHMDWYPPGYQEPPIITEGKIQEKKRR